MLPTSAAAQSSELEESSRIAAETTSFHYSYLRRGYHYSICHFHCSTHHNTRCSLYDLLDYDSSAHRDCYQHHCSCHSHRNNRTSKWHRHWPSILLPKTDFLPLLDCYSTSLQAGHDSNISMSKGDTQCQGSVGRREDVLEQLCKETKEYLANIGSPL